MTAMNINPARDHSNVFVLSQEQKDALENIPPYISNEDQKFIENCQSAYQKGIEQCVLIAPDTKLYQFKDIFNSALVLIELKDLVNFSEASKCCYLAAKANRIWENHFQKLFPNIQVIPNSKFSYSPEQQFKIYFHNFYETRKPFKEQYDSLQSKINLLVDAIGKDRKEIMHNETGVYVCAKTVQEYSKKLNELNNEKKCLLGIYKLISDTFNNQQEFEMCITTMKPPHLNLSNHVAFQVFYPL